MRYLGNKWLSAVLLSCCMSGPLAAQATRTWVSGVGDDANPCSRTAPCKTFAGAISKTAAGGEIDTLDPGGFGTLTITKSITIDGGGNLSGVLATGTNGMVILAGPNDVVVLRNLDINGTGTPAGTDTRGIKFLSGKLLVIDNCNVYDFPKRNISIESSTNNAQVLISNTLVHDGLNNGIVVSPPGGISNDVVLDNVRSVNNPNAGLSVAVGGVVQVKNSVLGNNGSFGLWADNSTVDVHSTLISGNLNGIQSQNSAIVRISDTTVAANGMGLSITTGGVVDSFGNNQIAGNGSGNSGVTAIPMQ
jgi:hypothetical protein